MKYYTFLRNLTRSSPLALRRRMQIALVGVAVLIAIIPMDASAGQVTNRSITLSSASMGATNVSYKVAFTPEAPAGAFVVEFCSNSPLVGQTCEAPAGFDAAGASSTTSGFSDVAGSTNRIQVAGDLPNGQPVSVVVNGITNPATEGQMYGRIVTYDTKQHASAYQSTDIGVGAKDSGGVALAISKSIALSGTVQETLQFCVSGQAIAADCSGTVAPSLKLGQKIDDTITILLPEQINEGDLYTQITTNALNGAVVRLKSNALNCGGLLRAGAPAACDIKPATSGGINPSNHEAQFGIKTSLSTNSPSPSATGQYRPAVGSIYSDTTFAMNYIAGNASGVTSLFGDPLLDTAGAPANNKNMKLTFGVTIANETPAGDYSADISLIATGRF